MADPKIRYDIEAGIKGEADVQALAATVRSLGDSLEGDLKTQALQAADALQGLGAKQNAVQEFAQLRRESESLGAELNTVTAAVDRLGGELPQATAQTARFAEAERAARAVAASARADLDEQRAALATLRAEYTGSARRSDEFREAQAQLLVSVKDLRQNYREQQSAVTTAAAATKAAQAAERGLSDQYERSIAEAKRLSAAVGDKGRALEATRTQLSSYGIQTTQLVSAERQLADAVAQVRERVVGLAPAFAQAATASSASAARQAADQRTVRDGVRSVGDELRKIQAIAATAVGGGILGGMVKDVAATADEFKNLQARMRLVTGEGDNFSVAFSGVTRIALATNSSLSDTGTLFARLATAGKDAGLQTQAATAQALGLTETINQAVQLSGSSAEASNAAITQLIQGLQSGVLRGDEFNSVMEQAPRLAQALANGVGRTTGELRQMAEQGALTTDVVVRALTTQAATVAAEFGKLPQTVGRSLQNLQTQWALYVGEQDKGFASSANLAGLINGLAKNLDVLVGSLLAAGKAWAAIKIAGLAADAYRWATATTGATAAVQANTAAVAANTVAHGANAAAQRASAAASAASGVAMRANTAQLASGAAVLGRFSGLLGPFGIAVAAVTPEIISLTRAAAEGVANWQGYGKAIADAEGRLKAQEAAVLENAQAQRAHAIALQEARDRQFALSKESQNLIARFDDMRKKGESAADAISRIGKDFDLASVPGVRNAGAVLDKLVEDGKISIGQFQQAWSQALQGVDLAEFEVRARGAFQSVKDDANAMAAKVEEAISRGVTGKELIDLQERARGAFSAVSRGAEQLQRALDEGAREAIKRTGLEFDVLAGRSGAASRSAINDTEAIIASMDRLQAQGVDTTQALTASIGRSINTADSQKSIDAIRGQIEALRKQLGDRVANGLLDQTKAKADDLKLSMDRLLPGIQSVGEAFRFFGLQTGEQLTRSANESREAYDRLKASGVANADQLREAFTRVARDATAANKGVPPSWLEIEDATIRAREEIEHYGRSTSDTLGRLQNRWKEYGETVRREGSATPGEIKSGPEIRSTTGDTREQRLAGQNAVDNRLMFDLKQRLEAGTLTQADAGAIQTVLASLAQNRLQNRQVDQHGASQISLEGRRDDAMWQGVGQRLEQLLDLWERGGQTQSTRHEVVIKGGGKNSSMNAASDADARKMVEALKAAAGVASR